MKASSAGLLDDVCRRAPALAPCRDDMAAACELLLGCVRAGGTILACGNGGSAADAEHIVGELMNRYRLCRPIPQAHARALQERAGPDAAGLVAHLQQSIRAVSLVSQTSLISAVANDSSPEMVFAQQVYGYGREGDALLAISTSGNARNVICALHAARLRGMHTIGLAGAKGGAMRPLCDVALCVPAEATYQVQELHEPLYHGICAVLENELFGR
jgi:D-sedoheptulose 7-phosphate isomerase